MQKILVKFCFAFIYFTGSCQSSEQKFYESTILDTGNVKGGLHQCSRSTPENILNYCVIEEKDKKQLEEKLSNFLSTVKLKPDEYAYQYIGVIIKGKKFIYINAFWKVFLKDGSFSNEWKTRVIDVCDGGHAFWGALFDIEKLEFSELIFSGSKGAQ